ncbi:hypothetical protein Dimus_022133, partial [Dionaea muscipula]
TVLTHGVEVSSSCEVQRDLFDALESAKEPMIDLVSGEDNSFVSIILPTPEAVAVNPLGVDNGVWHAAYVLPESATVLSCEVDNELVVGVACELIDRVLESSGSTTIS